MIALGTNRSSTSFSRCMRTGTDGISDVTEHQQCFGIFELCAVRRLGHHLRGFYRELKTALNQFFALLAVGDQICNGDNFQLMCGSKLQQLGKRCTVPLSLTSSASSPTAVTQPTSLNRCRPRCAPNAPAHRLGAPPTEKYGPGEQSRLPQRYCWLRLGP